VALVREMTFTTSLSDRNSESNYYTPEIVASNKTATPTARTEPEISLLLHALN